MSTARPAPVVVVVDGSGCNMGAVRYAIREARTRGAVVRLILVLDGPDSEGRQIVDQAIAEAGDGALIEVEGLLGHGPRVAELVAATAWGDLAVLGRASRRGVEALDIRATNAEVAARAVVPVVVVPAHWQARGHGRIVVGIRSFGSAGELLAHAFSSASARHATLRVVHAVEFPDRAEDLVDMDSHAGGSFRSGRRLLETIVRDWSAAFPDVEVELSVVSGRAALVLADAAADADLLVIARHHRDLRHLERLGPTARAVLGVSDTPVEVFPLTGEPITAPLALESSGTILKT